MTCQQIEPLLPSFVDGVAQSGDAALVAAHLSGCPACQRSAAVQASIRRVLQSQAAELSPMAPPGLRTRIAAIARAERPEAAGILGWRGRLSAFAAAAVTVMVVSAMLLPVLTSRSTVLLAAQLALDHLKCFTIDGDANAGPIGKHDAETTLQREFALTVAVPDGVAAEGLQLLAARRCLFGDGRAAHLLYRLNGEPVSLFVIPGLSRPATALSVMGHDQLVWTQGDRTYMLVSRTAARDRLARVALHLQNEAK